MAQMAHRLAGTELDLGDVPARPIPLRERFADGAEWRAREKSAALELARLRRWDCVHTRINLVPGEYKAHGQERIDVPRAPGHSQDKS